MHNPITNINNRYFYINHEECYANELAIVNANTPSGRVLGIARDYCLGPVRVNCGPRYAKYSDNGEIVYVIAKEMRRQSRMPRARKARYARPK